MIDLRDLPKEVADIIEIKEQVDSTFGNFIDNDYTDILWNILAERANPGLDHSMLMSITGLQGSGKCLENSEILHMGDGSFKRIAEVSVGDVLESESGTVEVLNKWDNKKECVKLYFDVAPSVVASKKHHFPEGPDLLKIRNRV